MRSVSRLASLWRSLVRGRALDQDLDAELQAAVDELAARHAARGLPAGEARRAALAELGGVEQVKEQVREIRPGHALETALRDVRHGWRLLWKSPAFAISGVLTLALGIGATTAIFTVVNAMLLEPLPYRDADRLVFVWADWSHVGYPRAPLAGPELKDLRDRSTLFSGFGGIWANTTALTGDGDPEQLRIGLVTADFFPVLGVEAAYGRTFNAGDEAQTASPGIVLSAALWQRRYGSDPSIVGRRVLVNNRPTTVIGVMPAGFRLLLPTDAAVPDDLQAWQLLNATYVNWPRGQQFLRVVGRMKSAVPLDAAQQEIAAIGGGIGREFKDYGSAGLTLYAVGLQDDGVREVRPALLALFGGVGILLVIACVNVAGLLVARAAARAKDTAVRMALGAGRVRLLRQCLTEGVLLAALGGAAGLLAGRAALAALMSLRPDELRRIEAAHLDGAVLAFTAGISLMWGLLLSLAPVVEVFRTDVTTALQRGGRKSGEAIHYRARGALVAAQMALSVVLLVTAVLLVRGFQRLQQVDPGFHADGVLTFRVALPGSRNNTRDALNVFSRNLRAKLAALPGVTATGAISHLPYDDLPNWGTPYLRETAVDESEAGVADSRAITPGYLEAVGAQLVEGRWFTEDDAPKTRPVALVDTRLAERMWPGQSAVGKRLRADPYTTGSPRVTVTIVGVVRHVRHRQLTRDVREQMYFPLAQAPRNPMAYVVRTSGDPAQLAPAVRQALLQLDPALPMYDVRPLADYLRSARAARRFTMTLAAAFAAAALALACIGVYGVTAYAVALRRHEFGVRMALGARAAEIVRLVLREGGVLALAGATAGLTGAGVAAALVRAQLYGVSPFDPLSYALAIAALAAAAFAACWIPARRAGAVSPLESLRAE